MSMRSMCQVVVVGLLLATFATPFSKAEDGLRVGVMRSTIPALGSSLETEQAQQLAQLKAKAREKYAAQMAQMQSMVAPMMQNLRETVGKQLPGVVQRTWVEMLEQKGIPAVELDAATAEDAKTEAKAKNVGWILSTEVRTEKAQGSPHQGENGMQLESTKLTLSVRYSLADVQGRTLLPWKTAVKQIEAVSAESMSTEDDIWAMVGNELVHGVESALPLGVVKYEDSEKYLPVAPDMGASLRLDMTSSSKQFYKGRLMPDLHDSEGKSIVEFADKSMTAEYKKNGLIMTLGSPVMYMVNDSARSYCRTALKDLEFEKILMASQPTEEVGHLERVGATGDIVTYNYRSPGSANTATVEVQYGADSPAWQQGIVTLKAMANGRNEWPVTFGEMTDHAMGGAIWEELAKSAAPPVRVSIKEETVPAGKKKADFHSEYETKIDTSQLPRPVDFTIPKSYKWHSNMMLSMAWVL